MPRVPVYDSFQVAPGTLPGIQQTAPKIDDMVRVTGVQQAQFGKAMAGLGGQLAANAITMQIDINEAAAKTADSTLADTMRELLHNPESGYLNQSGKTAVDGFKPTSEAIDKAVEEAGKGLENDAQRLAFRDAAMRRRQQALGVVETHAAQQTKQYNIDATTARIGSNERDMVTAAAAWKIPGSAYAMADATRKDEIEALIDQKFGAKADPAIKDAARLEYNTRAHIATLDEMLSKKQVKDAQEYFATKLREIDPEKQDNIRKALETASRQDTVLTYSDNLFASVKGFGAQMKQVQADFEAGKIDGQERTAIESRIEHKRSVALSQQAESEKYAMGQAYDFLQKNPGKSVEDLPPNVYRNVLTHLPGLRSFAAQEGKTTTDPTIYYGLRQMAANEPENFAKLNLLTSRDKLAPSDWKHLVELQGNISKNDASAIAQQKSFGMALKSVDADMKAAGIDTTPKEGSAKAKELAQFKTSLLQALDEEQKQKGRALTFEESRKVGLDQLKQGWLQGSGIFFDDKARKYQLIQGNKYPFVATRYADIPASTRDELTMALRNSGAKVTNEEVERMYQRGIDQGRFK
jgi:DNA-directed RNA polymerase subunit F